MWMPLDTDESIERAERYVKLAMSVIAARKRIIRWSREEWGEHSPCEISARLAQAQADYAVRMAEFAEMNNQLRATR